MPLGGMLLFFFFFQRERESSGRNWEEWREGGENYGQDVMYERGRKVKTKIMVYLFLKILNVMSPSNFSSQGLFRQFCERG